MHIAVLLPFFSLLITLHAAPIPQYTSVIGGEIAGPWAIDRLTDMTRIQRELEASYSNLQSDTLSLPSFSFGDAIP
ncbi:hypothetical protein PENTCL1PPCAC_18801 [Pristionchus entomophagus]|uniref:Uncharacterized protein n=1 Tax=Pristionchus entomophagus TaxID=358040 RepID=A0AAV5TQM7_9BILA|nr:hypothetical protein PENTCL1PPCAC_18801 [Pristionchus entomophagus]